MRDYDDADEGYRGYKNFKAWSRAWKSERTRRKHEARDIYELQMREAVIRWTQEQIPDKEIAQRLGQTVPEIKRYREDALAQSAQRYRTWGRAGLSTPPSRKPRALPAPGASSSSSSASMSGEVLDPQDVIEMRAHCLKMKKAAVPYEKMAEILGISREEAQKYSREAIAELQNSEQLNADLERRLMLEQIDQMIAAIHAPATGENLLGHRVTVVFDAIDKMLKLMKAKADLLGLSSPPAVDIRIKLQSIASESGYDIVDLEEIAREVLQAHKLKLPEFR
jgi:DNA-binding CsgD family transcriptional regulator